MAHQISKQDLGVLLNQPGFSSSEAEMTESGSEWESGGNGHQKDPHPPPTIKATVHIVGTNDFYVMTNANLHFAKDEQVVGREKACTIRKKEQLVRILCIGGN
jgi:hypothetical protein